MGWRADQAYEDAQREGFQKWRASLTWREFFGWEMRRYGPLLAGATATTFILWILMA